MENVDIFNKRREKLENIRERGKLEKNEYSISVHVWLLEEDKLWIQQRSNEKKIFPGLWEQSGGGVISGETSLEAVKRETKEELGLDIQDEEITYIGSYTRVTDIVDIWLVQRIFSKDKIILQDEEVANIKNVTFEEFDKMIENKEVVPTINPSYNLLKEYIEKEFEEIPKETMAYYIDDLNNIYLAQKIFYRDTLEEVGTIVLKLDMQYLLQKYEQMLTGAIKAVYVEANKSDELLALGELSQEEKSKLVDFMNRDKR